MVVVLGLEKLIIAMLDCCYWRNLEVMFESRSSCSFYYYPSSSSLVTLADMKVVFVL